MENYENLIDDSVKVRVSSVLDNNVKEFGKQFLFTEDEENAWSSNNGSPQFILMVFERPVTVKRLRFVFQAGYGPQVYF